MGASSAVLGQGYPGCRGHDRAIDGLAAHDLQEGRPRPGLRRGELDPGQHLAELEVGLIRASQEAIQPCDPLSFRSGQFEFRIEAQQRRHHVGSRRGLAYVPTQRGHVLDLAAANRPRSLQEAGQVVHSPNGLRQVGQRGKGPDLRLAVEANLVQAPDSPQAHQVGRLELALLHVNQQGRPTCQRGRLRAVPGEQVDHSLQRLRLVVLKLHAGSCL